jgi:hypothetical protein
MPEAGKRYNREYSFTRRVFGGNVDFSIAKGIDFYYFQVDNTESIVCKDCVCDLIGPFSSKPVQKQEAIKC